MKVSERANYISRWIMDYCFLSKNNPKSLIIGVSGGIDSSVASTLCAKTGLKTIVISMPIKQNKIQHNLSLDQIKWLK